MQNFRRKYTHTLDAVLIMPVQRLARYDLLLAQAHKVRVPARGWYRSVNRFAVADG